MVRNKGIWACLLLGILLIADGVMNLLVDGFYWRGAFIPSWTAWPLMFLGIVICIISIRGLWRGRGQPEPEKTDIDEAAARAKAEMDRIYLREHGKLPESTEKEHGFLSEAEKPAPVEQTPQPEPPNPKSGLSLRRCLRFKDLLDAVPYETVLLMAKGKADPPAIPASRQGENTAEALSKADVLLYAFMANPKIRQGLHALAASGAIALAMAAGLDWLILSLAIPVLLVFAIARIAGGSVEIL